MEIRLPTSRAEHRAALCRLIDSAGAADPQARERVEVLENYVHKRGLSLEHCMIAADEGHVHAVCLLLDSPGRTSTVLLSPGSTHTQLRPVVIRMLEQSLRKAAGRGVQLLQGMIPPECGDEVFIYRAAGFNRLANLIYMQTDLHLHAPPRAVHRLNWESYGPHTHQIFAAAIERTYENSLDCGSLNGVRDIEDILASHKATGQFRPECWQLGYAGSEPVGVILLGYMEEQQSHEVVYIGCVPRFRGQGYGVDVLAHAVELTRAHGLNAITLSVDEKNRPARRLYAKFGFYETARREVWIRILSTSDWQ